MAETSLADAQDLLRILRKQWQREEHQAAKERGKGRFAEGMLWDDWYKDQKYGLKVPEEMRRAIEFMDPNARLKKLKMKLQLSPRRIAIQYVEWAHRFLSTREPDPLPEMLKRMVGQVQEQIGEFGTARETRGAEGDTFILVELYTLALSLWTEEIRTSLLLISATLAPGARLLPHRPALLERLVCQLERLSVYRAVVEKIEADYLNAHVVPRILRDLLLHVEKECAAACERLGGSECGEVAKALEPTHLSAQVQARLQSLISEALTRASLESCHRSALSLAQTEVTMMARLKDWELCRPVFEDSTGGEPDRSPRSTPAPPPPTRRTGKPQQSKRSGGRHD